MEKRAVFSHKFLPYLLLAPQLAITIIFFYLPASQALRQSFFIEDAFGTNSDFVGLENYRYVFADPSYYKAIVTTAIFAAAVTICSLSFALLLAVMADREIKGATVYRTLLVWPYAVAPAIAGVLFIFLFQPSLGMLARGLTALGVDWNPLLDGKQALTLVIVAATWKQISYNFLFFLAGLQAIPKSLIEAAAIDGARPWRRFWTVQFPLLSPTTFFLLVINVVYAFFDTFAIVDTATQGGPGTATRILVYKVYHDGFKAMDLGGSAAQSVVLMAIVVVLTVVQFRYVEKKVQY